MTRRLVQLESKVALQDDAVLKVRDLMTENLAFIAAQDTVMEAAKLMSEKRISCIVVKCSEEFSGILTDRDIIDRVVSKGLDPAKIRVIEVMSSPLTTISDEEPIEEAAKKMRDKRIRRLVVERNHKKVGIITESNIVRVDPELHFLIRERSKLEAKLTRTQPQETLLTGSCDECENYSSELKNMNGRWLCEDCEE